jgi:succinoglycan biosynthesis protein ExoO
MSFSEYSYAGDHADHSTPPELVSIITPAFRATDTIAATVRSVLTQTYPHWEMLIVSDDGVDYQDVLKRNNISDERLRFFKSRRFQSGPSAARNIALEEARGALIAPLDADDSYYASRLEKLVPVALEYGMAGDNAHIIDSRANTPIGTLLQPSYRMYWLALGDFLSIHTPFLFVFRKDLIRSAWDEDIRLGADTLFNMRGVEQVQKVPVFTEILHEYHIRPGSICHSADSHLRADEAYTLSLKRLDQTALGFSTGAAMETVRTMLVYKQNLNRLYMQSLNKGKSRNFSEFIAANNLLFEGAQG